MKRQVPQKKLETVQQIRNLADEYPIVGVVDMENLPAKQLQNMREQLRGTVIILMSKKRLIRIALQDCKNGVDKLADYMAGMPALIFTRQNPFTLYKKLSTNRSTAPAKAGQKATKDIVVPAGPTNFSPGPIIGELGSLKIKTAIEDGKVAVKEDCLVAREGDEISAQLARILSRMGIEPMEIGLELVAVCEEGEIFKKDVLAIDEDEFMGRVACAAGEAFSLAMFIGHLTDETSVALIQKAHSDARALSLSEGLLPGELVEEVLARTEAQAKALAGLVQS